MSNSIEEIDLLIATLNGLNDPDSIKRIKDSFCFKQSDIDDLDEKITYFVNDKYPVGHTKGSFLEEFSKDFLSFSGIFNINTNIYTSTNEIDLLLSLTPKGSVLRGVYYPDFPETGIIAECKNYKDKIGVTWIGKFFSLIKSHNMEMGILFSTKGVAGRGKWDSSKGLIRKLCLKENVTILDISVYDFKQSIGDNIFDILLKKFNQVNRDCKINKIENHPGQK